MNKKITFVCESFLPERTAGSNRAASVVNTLLKNGYSVSVCFLMPIGSDCINYIYPSEFENVDNLTLIPVARKKYIKSNLISRFLNESKQAKNLMVKSLCIDSEIIIVSVPMLMLLPVSAWYLRTSKQRKILEVRDLIWRYYEFKTDVISKFISMFLTMISLFAINKFDQVVTVTQRQKKWILENSVSKVVAIENGIDIKTLNLLSTINSFNDSNSILYAGSIGYPQNLAVLVDAVYYLQKSGRIVKLTIIGSGPEFEKISELISLRELVDTQILPSVSFEELVVQYREHNILYGQLRDIPSLETAVPTKVFEYLAMSKNIIFGVNGEAKDILLKFKGATVVAPDNSEALANAILDIITDKKQKINNFDQLHSDYLRENLIEKYIDIL